MDSAIPRLTLAATTSLEGVGLFTGRPSRLTIRPAEAGGIWFRRTDLPGEPACRATVASLSQRAVHPAFEHTPARCTVLETGAGDLVATTEHLLSALGGLGVTDACLDLHGPEVPLLDASAIDFVRTIRSAGLRGLGPLQQPTLRRTVEVREGAAWAVARPRPEPGWSFQYHLDYSEMGGPLAAEAAAIGVQSAAWDGSPEQYEREVSPARTFCLQGEAAAMRGAGLLTHLNEGDALVIGAGGPIGTTYRMVDEPARHKLLDLIGDVSLVGARPRMDVEASRAGHALNHRLAREVRRALGPG